MSPEESLLAPKICICLPFDCASMAKSAPLILQVIASSSRFSHGLVPGGTLMIVWAVLNSLMCLLEGTGAGFLLSRFDVVWATRLQLLIGFGGRLAQGGGR